MEATLFNIVGRSRPFAAASASPEHFTLDSGLPVSARLVIDEPGWSPYCLDDPNRSVLFVHTPPEVDLAQAAFVYTAQFEQAQRALSVPYAALSQMVDDLPVPDNFILVYSIGRCGTTLMSKILSLIDDVYSLSEPDVYTNFSQMRATNDNSRDAELTPVLKACTLLLALSGKQQHPLAVALKFRSNFIGLSGWMYDAFPSAHNLFMYRNAQTWMQSVYHFLDRLGLAKLRDYDQVLRTWRGITGEEAAYVEPYLDQHAATFDFADLLAPAWTSFLERYMMNYERGVPFHTITYEDLTDRSEESLRSMLAYCGLPASAVEQAMPAFETDSQAGTAISRDIEAADLTPEQIDSFLKALSRHPRFNRPDFVLPSAG